MCSINQLLATLSQTVISAVSLEPLGGDGTIKTGCVFILAMPDGNDPFRSEYGTFGDNGADPYYEAAANKIAALQQNPDVIASREVRDIEAEPKIWSGAIRLLDGRIMAISGFPEALDEAIGLKVALEHNLIYHQIYLELDMTDLGREVESWLMRL